MNESTFSEDRLQTVLRETAEEMEREAGDPPPELAEGVMERIRAERALAPGARPAGRGIPLRHWLPCAAAAAVILLAVGLFLPVWMRVARDEKADLQSSTRFPNFSGMSAETENKSETYENAAEAEGEPLPEGATLTLLGELTLTAEADGRVLLTAADGRTWMGRARLAQGVLTVTLPAEGKETSDEAQTVYVVKFSLSGTELTAPSGDLFWRKGD